MEPTIKKQQTQKVLTDKLLHQSRVWDIYRYNSCSDISHVFPAADVWIQRIFLLVFSCNWLQQHAIFLTVDTQTETNVIIHYLLEQLQVIVIHLHNSSNCDRRISANSGRLCSQSCYLRRWTSSRSTLIQHSLQTDGSLRGQRGSVLLLCGWIVSQQGVYVGRSLGRVTYCHHRGGRSPSLRAGGRASVFGPPALVSASSWATWNQTGGDKRFRTWPANNNSQIIYTSIKECETNPFVGLWTELLKNYWTDFKET